MKLAAGTLTISKDNKVLMIKSKKHVGKYHFAGGKAEKGESPEETAIRETLEETGIKCKIASSNSFFVDKHKELKDYAFHCFVAIEDSGNLTSSDEGDPCWVDIKNVLNLPLAYPDWTKDAMNYFGIIK